MPKIAALHAASWKDAYRDILPADYLAGQVDDDLREHWRSAQIGPQDCVLVAVEDEKIVGFIGVWVRDEAFIDNLHAAPEMRSKGIGAKLMQAAAAILREQGERTAYLHVITENKRALGFYERLGGEVTQTLMRDVFGTPKLHYKVEWRDLSVLASSNRSS